MSQPLQYYTFSRAVFKLTAILFALQNFCIVGAVPNISQISSDITILSDNDLYYTNTSRTSTALLLHSPVPYSNAQKSCALLSEILWNSSTPGQGFLSGLNSSLAYQVYINSFPGGQKFWIGPPTLPASSLSSKCPTINTLGIVSFQSCTTRLPTLCTHHAPFSASTSPEYQITVRSGSGQQVLTGNRDFFTFRFLGVRFAPQPKRLAYSELYNGTGDIEMALEPRDMCFQIPGVGSEDCLFLNIWTPYLPHVGQGKDKPKKKLKAVMVWIFGGGFITGTGYNTGSDGAMLSSRGDVLVISLNYRLGNLGFLALHDGITNGNFGLQDIFTALQWIQKNIEAFGGDKDRVTIFGQSAGAAAVRALLTMPKAKGLFAAAIMQSTPVGFSAFDAYANYSTIESSYASVAVPILAAVGCLNVTDQLECLRGKSGSEIVNIAVYANSPVIDGSYIVSPGLPLNGQGYAASVPILTGTVRNEEAIAVPYPTSPSLSQALDDLSALLGLNVTSIYSTGAFPLPPGSDSSLSNFNLTDRIVTDGGLHCLTQATAYSGIKSHLFPSAYTYKFNRTAQPPDFTRDVCEPPKTAEHPLGDTNAEYFKCHAGEVIWVFGTFLKIFPARDELDILFSQLVVDYWSAFARTNDPNPENGYLSARGYWTSMQQIQNVGKWEELRFREPTSRLLQWNGRQVPFDEVEQCNALGLPLNYFETRK